jgi:hypothetical protein
MAWGDIWDDIVGGATEIGGLFTGETSFSDLADNFSSNVKNFKEGSLYEHFSDPKDPITGLITGLGSVPYYTGKGVLDVFDFSGDALGNVAQTVTGDIAREDKYIPEAVYSLGGDLAAGGVFNPRAYSSLTTKGLLGMADDAAKSTFKIRAPYPAPSNVMGMNAPINFKMGNFTLPNNMLTRAFTRDYKFGFPRTGKYSQYIPGRIALDGQRTFAPVKGWGAYETGAYAPELADKFLFDDELGDKWLPSYTKYKYNQNIEKEEQKAKEAEEKQLEQMNEDGIFTQDQIRTETDLLQDNTELNNFIDYINPSKIDTISVKDFKNQFD